MEGVSFMRRLGTLVVLSLLQVLFLHECVEIKFCLGIALTDRSDRMRIEDVFFFSIQSEGFVSQSAVYRPEGA